jgi:hypothetical protein
MECPPKMYPAIKSMNNSNNTHHDVTLSKRDELRIFPSYGIPMFFDEKK